MSYSKVHNIILLISSIFVKASCQISLKFSSKRYISLLQSQFLTIITKLLILLTNFKTYLSLYNHLKEKEEFWKGLRPVSPKGVLPGMTPDANRWCFVFPNSTYGSVSTRCPVSTQSNTYLDSTTGMLNFKAVWHLKESFALSSSFDVTNNLHWKKKAQLFLI